MMALPTQFGPKHYGANPFAEGTFPEVPFEPPRPARFTGSARAVPLHLPMVALLAIIWNGFGVYDFALTKLSPGSYLPSVGMSAVDLAYYAAMPGWLSGLWALGVGMALLGSLLLMARRAAAVLAFGGSLVGLAGGEAARLFVVPPPADMQNWGVWGVTALIWALALGFWAYAVAQKRAGRLTDRLLPYR